MYPWVKEMWKTRNIEHGSTIKEHAYTSIHIYKTVKVVRETKVYTFEVMLGV